MRQDEAAPHNLVNATINIAASNIAYELNDFPLDVLGQHPRINRLYTQITLCFPLSNDSPGARSEIIGALKKGIERLSVSFPWVTGKVVNDNGCFKIQPFGKSINLTVRDLGNEGSVPDWEALRQANFPFSMLDECDLAPRKTLPEPGSDLPVFLTQANFIAGGLLLTFNGQHGSMDMAGQSHIIQLLAKACRNELFTSSELSVGNMDRRNIIPLLKDEELDHEVLNQVSVEGRQTTHPQSTTPSCIWAYFLFSSTSLAALKLIASKTVPSGAFVSTDDVLTVFVWQHITHAPWPRLDTSLSPESTLSRTVDVRHYLSIPPIYPGLVTSSTVNTLPMKELLEEPLGSIAAQLRSALNPTSLAYKTRKAATEISRHGGSGLSNAGASSPELDVRLSSWAKEKFYELDFGVPGLGKQEAVRRPRFADGAREGLVYFLPRALDGDICVGVCLRLDDLERLKADERFAEYAVYIG